MFRMKSIGLVLERKESLELLADEIHRYIQAMNPTVPKQVQAVLYILDKYPQLNSKEQILSIRDGKFNLLKKLDILPDDLKDLQRMLKKLGNDIKLLPQFLTAHQRQLLELGKLHVNDVTLDLETEAGRQNVVKQYSPLVIKIANQWVGKSTLDKSELISAGLVGLTNAMNDYKNPEQMSKEGKDSNMSFGSYAAYCIRNQILIDIEKYSNTVRQNYYNRTKNGSISIFSIDRSYGQTEDGDDIKIDRMMDLSEEPKYELSKRDTDLWKEAFKKLEKRFSRRDCEVFYRVFGVNGYKNEKAKDVANDLKISGAMVSHIIRRTTDFLRHDPESLAILKEILSMYTESLVSELYNKPKEIIEETLLGDDLFLLSEEVNRWPSANALKNAVNQATDKLSTEDALYIYDCFKKGFDYMDSRFRKMKPVIITFLTNMNYTTTFKNKSDVEILEYMSNLINDAKTLEIKW